jgi:transposase
MRGPPGCLRDLTAEEALAVKALARSRTAAARRVERARVVGRAGRGETPPAVAAALGLDAETARRRIRRFDAEGMAALEDHHRSGRPPTYSAGEVATVIAAALTAPRSLGLPFASWRPDRLAAYLLEHKGIAMRRSRIDEILLEEGLRWRRQEPWFGARIDPQFAEERGGSRRSTPRRRRAAQSSAWTRWGRSAPRAIQVGTWCGRNRHRRAGPSGRSTTAGAARATSSAPSAPPPAPPSPGPIPGPWGCPPGRLPGGGRELAAAGHRAGPCHRRRPEQPPRPRRAAAHAGAPALGDGVPAEVRGLPRPHRAVVEGAALPRVGWAALRDPGRDRRRRRASNRPLECAPPPLRPGTAAASSPTPSARHRTPAEGRVTCRMNH